MYLRFSELNSDSRNLRNCSLPTGSLKTSSMPKAHLFTLCWPGSLLQYDAQKATHLSQMKCVCVCKALCSIIHKIYQPVSVSIEICIAFLVYRPCFKLPECGVVWDPGVGWIWRCEEGVVFNVLLCVAQQTVVFQEKQQRSYEWYRSLSHE